MKNKEKLIELIKETMIEEGFFDRMKARTSGVTSGLKNTVKGKLDAVDAKLFGQESDKYNAAKNLKLGKNKYDVAKIENYKKTANKKLENVANEIMSDLGKLGIDTKGISAKQVNFFKNSINQSLQNLIDQIPTGPK